MSKELRQTAKTIVIIGVAAAVITIIAGIAITVTNESSWAALCGFCIAGGVLFVAFLISDLLKGFAELLERSAAQEAYLKTICEELQGKDTTPPQPVSPAVPVEDVKVKVKTAATEATGTAEALLVADDGAGPADLQMEICSACGKIQRAGRNVCWKCGAKFARSEQ
ncbi:MAG: hypothetical protein IJA77_09045 [Clostridia bacterium]|nr:hypothetical protein [Clostridia bacterium]